MKKESAEIKRLKEYKPLDYLIKTCDLEFFLSPTKTKVIAKSKFVKNPKCSDSKDISTIYLNGEKLELLMIKVDGVDLSEDDYTITDEGLSFLSRKDSFDLEVVTEINPKANTELQGLYLSSGIYCTQNEAEGFRKITYFFDRPDNMTIFSCKINEDHNVTPVMLANGNLVAEGKNADGSRWVKWEDPFPKPCYLFALVAGELGVVEDTYKTTSGRDVKLQIFVDKGNESKCDHAMESLKNSMKWDEDVYGLEYDLDIYMIVAVDSFNMGAMENKGLNIFNSAYVLADEKSATDHNFLGVESVIGHEYFHNWTGNRITCRDWFQLTLKEGLTVFRDQEFSADLNIRTVKRIEDVARLRSSQFVEDSGPSSHPIKPDEYIEINNFYTATIYEKGAEVIRMIHTLLGGDGFRRGMDKYFELFDGQAVTTEDFIHAMSVANENYDFEQFKRWYSQRGTPTLSISTEYDEGLKELKIRIVQKCPKTLEEDNWKPYHLPLKIGLVSRDGGEVSAQLACEYELEKNDWNEKGFIHINKVSSEFVLKNVEESPILSVNQDFSAPVIINYEQSIEDKLILLKYDKNAFNRYETAQNLAMEVSLDLIKADENGDHLEVSDSYIDSFGFLLNDESVDNETKALCLSLPSFSALRLKLESLNTSSIFMAQEVLKKTLALRYEADFLELFNSLKKQEAPIYDVSPKQVGVRALKRVCLSFLMALNKQEYNKVCFAEFSHSTNMTDEINSLNLLIHFGENKVAEEAIEAFYTKWKHETLVVQKWISSLATSPKEDTLMWLEKIQDLPEYSNKVPNLVRSLVGQFALNNPRQFHRPDGFGYEFVANQLLDLDSINPQISARIAGSFNIYDKLQTHQKNLMKIQIEKVLKKSGLSKNTFEILSKIKL